MTSRTLLCAWWALCVLVSGGSRVGASVPDVSRSYEHQTWRAENGLPQNSVHSIVQTSDGYLWLATEGGLARFDGIKFVVFGSENTPQLRSNTLRSLLEGPDQALWIATADGLARLHRGAFSSFTTAEGLPSNDVLSLALDRDHALLVTTSEGSARYEGGRFLRTTRSAPTLPPEAKQMDVQTTLTDHLGRVWIGTSNGLVVLQNGLARNVALGSSLRGRRISTLHEDRLGTLWIGTDHGVA